MTAAFVIPCLLRGGTEQQTLQLVRAVGEWGRAEDGRRRAEVICYFEFDPAMVAEFEAAGAEVRLLNLPRSISSWRLVQVLREEFARSWTMGRRAEGRGQRAEEGTSSVHRLTDAPSHRRTVLPSDRPTVAPSHRRTVLHVQYMAPGLLPIIAARLAGIRNIVATVHQPASAQGLKAKLMLRFAARLCRKFTCVSEAAERSWFGDSHLYDPSDAVSGRRRHVTIPNAVDTERVQQLVQSAHALELRRHLGLGEGPVVGTVSRLRHEKGIDLLVDAMAHVHRTEPTVQLLVVGDGPDAEKLRSRAETLGLAKCCVWTGKQSWDDAMRLLAVLDIFVVPSRFEGFGLSAAEAMAAGKLVIASDVDGLAEVIGRDGAGVQFPSEDPAALAAAIIDLLRDPVRRDAMAEAGRRRVCERFSVELFRKRMVGVYEEVGGEEDLGP